MTCNVTFSHRAICVTRIFLRKFPSITTTRLYGDFAHEIPSREKFATRLLWTQLHSFQGLSYMAETLLFFKLKPTLKFLTLWKLFDVAKKKERAIGYLASEVSSYWRWTWGRLGIEPEENPGDEYRLHMARKGLNIHRKLWQIFGLRLGGKRNCGASTLPQPCKNNLLF